MYSFRPKLNLTFTREFCFLTYTPLYPSLSHALHCIPVSHLHSTVSQFLTYTPLYPSLSHTLHCIPVSHLHSTVSQFITCTPLYPSFSPALHCIPVSGLKQGVEQFAWRFINILLLFGRRRNCLKSGRSRSKYLFIRRGLKQILIIIGAYHFWQTLTKFIQNTALKFNPICEGNYRGSSMWLSTQQVDY
jgi:hypothetical protein